MGGGRGVVAGSLHQSGGAASVSSPLGAPARPGLAHKQACISLPPTFADVVPRTPPHLSSPPPCSEYSHSMVVGTQAPKELGTLRAADGAEGLSDKK